MSKVAYWFYLEPFVYTAMKGSDRIILYNTINGALIEYFNEPDIYKLVKRLSSNRNMYVIGLEKKDLENTKISSFIQNVKQNFMGDLMDRARSHKKPFQMMPILKLDRDVEELREEQRKIIKDDVKMNFFELVIYVNSGCNQNCDICRNMFKQHTFCNQNTGGVPELEMDSIETLLTESSRDTLGSCTITGGNIFLYSQFERLADYLNRLEIDKKICVHYLNINSHSEPKLEMLEKGKVEMGVLLHFPVDNQKISTAISILNKFGFNYNFQIIIQHESDLEQVNPMINDYGIQNTSLHPFYNGSNLDFLKKAVFIEKDDLIQAKPSYEQIFTRMHINPNYFGKLTVRSNGDIYANLNMKPIGNLNDDFVPDVIYNEITEGESWRATRSKIEPCKNCVYDLLCPSLSNYEYALGRNNLCHIY